jgi:hypothetical protein
MLAISNHYPIIVPKILTYFASQQAANVSISVSVWLVKRNSAQRTDIKEQHMMFDQVRFIPVPVPVLPQAIACHVITSLYKPDCPKHIGQMMQSPFKADFKAKHFENYGNIYATGTWNLPVLRSLLPKDVLLLLICPVYAIKSTYTESLWELQVRSYANGSRIKQGIHFDE